MSIFQDGCPAFDDYCPGAPKRAVALPPGANLAPARAAEISFLSATR